MDNPPTPLASTAMEAAREIREYINGDQYVTEKFVALLDPTLAAIIQKHFQPLLAKVEGERDAAYSKIAAYEEGEEIASETSSEIRKERDELKRMLGNRRDQIFVDASPDEELPTRILSCYLDHGQTISNPPELGLLMNKWQAERNEILRKAIAGLQELTALRADLAAIEARVKELEATK